jgi:hypothetical protein
MAMQHRRDKDECKPRQKKCERHHGHHHGHDCHKKKKCAPKHPWQHPGRGRDCKN